MTLAAIVVVPARDEEVRIACCLEALASQTISNFETIVVLDACADATEEVTRRAAARLGLSVHLITGPGGGSGPARRLAMDLAAERLMAAGAPDGLIASTDADTRPASSWLERQLAHVGAGARVIAGRVELDPAERFELPVGALRRRRRDAARRLERVRRLDPKAEHHHFAGASLGITAAVYRSVGGMEPLAALEDAAFAARLAAHGIPVLRAADVEVYTSARLLGRARRGLSVDLEVSTWSEQRRYDAIDFPLDRLRRLKGHRSIAVVIPTKECAATIGCVLERTVGPAANAGLIEEIVVIDADSADGTAGVADAAGARVVQQNEVLAEAGPALGKGDALWRSLAVTEAEIVCFLDGDTEDPDPRHLQGLIGPLVLDSSVMLVKGTFDRPFVRDGVELPHEGGRVTEIMARPLLNLYEPRLAGFMQPLAGEFAGRRDLLHALPFPAGYGVEIALLIDALRRCGLDALAECNLGVRHNRHQPLRALGEMAYAVLAAVERRVGDSRAIVGGHYLRPWEDGAIAQVSTLERPPLIHQTSATSAAAARNGSPTVGSAVAPNRGTSRRQEVSANQRDVADPGSWSWRTCGLPRR